MVGFIVVLVLLLSIVPVATLCATGSLRATREALRGYLMVLGIIWGAGALLALFGAVAYIVNS